MSEEKPDLLHIGERYDSLLIENQALRGHSFVQCTFNHVTISPFQDMHGTTFYGCEATFIEAPGVVFNHFSARDCNFQHGNFKGAKFYQSRLQKCDFTWSDFTDADLALCYSEGSDFKLSHLHKAKKVNAWDRDQVSELVRHKAKGDVEILMIASLIKNSFEFCWKEYETLATLPQYQKVLGRVHKILKEYPQLEVESRIAYGG